MFDQRQINFGQCADLIFQSAFVSRHDLVGHGFAGLCPDFDQGFAGENAGCAAGDGDDHDAGKVAVGGIVADDDGGSAFGDFVADCWIKFDPPDVTAFHRLSLC